MYFLFIIRKKIYHKLNKTMLYGKKWTGEEDEKLLESIKNNKTFVEIANEHERTTRAIECRACLHALKYMEGEQKSMEESCTKFNLQKATLETYIDYKNNKDSNKNKKNGKENGNSMDKEQYENIINILTEIRDMLKKQEVIEDC